MPVTPLKTLIGVPNAPKATGGAVLAIRITCSRASLVMPVRLLASEYCKAVMASISFQLTSVRGHLVKIANHSPVCIPRAHPLRLCRVSCLPGNNPLFKTLYLSDAPGNLGIQAFIPGNFTITFWL